jgi:hypothetical protein
MTLDDEPSRAQLDLAVECTVATLRDALNGLGLIAHAADDDIGAKDCARDIRQQVIDGIERELKEFKSVGF